MTISAPMMPPAPGRLSITICWPILSPNDLESTRAAVSACPAGVKGTTQVIGLVG
jgi:hypothetical protein